MDFYNVLIILKLNSEAMLSLFNLKKLFKISGSFMGSLQSIGKYGYDL